MLLLYKRHGHDIRKQLPLALALTAEFLLTYPPGIPIVCSGERITQDIITYVQALKDANLYVQGTEDPNVEKINIVEI